MEFYKKYLYDFVPLVTQNQATMKQLLTILIICSLPFGKGWGWACLAQNLVPNPSFEDYSSCPNNAGQISNAIGWEFYNNSSPEYLHSCATVSEYLVPQNLFGYQTASSGNAYAGFIGYDVNGFYREIFGVQLTNNLTSSQKYYVSLRVNRADSNFFAGYSIDKIGIKFFTTQPAPTSMLINNSAHFYSSSVITDTSNWTQLFGSFVADSAYQYLLIGNFFDDGNTTVVNDLNGPWAYYYVDDVCVSIDSNYAYNYTYTGIPHNLLYDKVLLYPNPSSGNVFLSTTEYIQNVTIYSSLGKVVKLFYPQKKKEQLLNLSNLPIGIYYVHIKLKKESITKKIIIIH